MWDDDALRAEIEDEFRPLARLDRRWQKMFRLLRSNAAERPLAANEPEPGLFVCAECGADFESRFAGVVVCTPGCARERDARLSIRTRDRAAERAREAKRLQAMTPSSRSLAVQAAMARKRELP